jgi:hypothetical protein
MTSASTMRWRESASSRRSYRTPKHQPSELSASRVQARRREISASGGIDLREARERFVVAAREGRAPNSPLSSLRSSR